MVFYNERMSRVRLMTFNIAHGRGLSVYQGFQSADRIFSNLQRIRQVLAQAEADVVAMQEVDQDSFWNHHVDCLAVLGADRQFEHSFMGVNSHRAGRRRLSYGNGLLSRHPIRAGINRPFGAAHPGARLRQVGGKGFMYAELDVDGLVLPIVNLHLDFRSRRQRLRQVDQIMRFLAQRRAQDTCSPVVCGDFNCSPARRDDAVARLLAWLNDTEPYQLVPNTEPTFPTHFPARTLDHVFMPARFKVRSADVLPVNVSDHRPVLVDFEVVDA